MLRNLTLTLSFILAVNLVIAAGNLKQPGGRSAGLGSASVTLVDMWGAFNNQASLAYLKQPEFGFYYENRFMVKEMGYKAAAMVYPFKFAVLSVSADHFGFSAHNESKLALGCSKIISKHLAVGVQLDYLMFRQDKEYGSRNIVTMELGLLVKLNDKLSFGTHIYNPVHSKLTNHETDEIRTEFVPVVFRAGVSYKVANDLTLHTEVQKNLAMKPSLKVGIEYALAKKFYIRAGMITNTSSVAFGFGIPLGKLNIDVSASYHQNLGFSPQASTSYKF